jgi:hypothetical protein
MIRTSSILGAFLSAAVAVPALAQSMTPTEAYLAYRQDYKDAQSFRS